MGFYDNYVRLCNEIGKAPNVVAREIGLKSSGTVTGWKNKSMPRQTVLAKLAAYFGTSVEELIADEKTPATEVTGDVDIIRDEIMPRVEQLSQKEVLRLIGELAQRIERGNKNDEG